METKNIMIVGVGGQGTLLASKLLGNLLVGLGYDVKVSEVHGMSQRGGSVVTYVRFGDKVYSPLVAKGEADYILSFEKLEAARYVQNLRRGGLVITNNRETDPMPVITGAAAYPHDVLDRLEALGVRVDQLDALTLAEQAGSTKAVNLVLIGRLSTYFPEIPEEKWLKSLEAVVAPRFVEMNKTAFALGRRAK
ncbi:MAG: indolepyruvate oxidoreductase subunit beta [Clostridia bacterium]|nr:indolepyruvate oxidoreductase subunit beta [Clostridia bacterium]